MHELGRVIVEATPSPSTYSFASPLTGRWESGAWRRATVQTRQAAVRLVGTQVLFKQWLPHEPEPSWDDPDRTVINLLPDTLPSGAPTPLGPGGVGLLIAHLGDGRQVQVARPPGDPAGLSHCRPPGDRAAVSGGVRSARGSRP